MVSYFYLISSLPELTVNGNLPITYDEFLNYCQSNVSEKKYELLENLTLDATAGSFMKEWSVVYSKLKNELNYQRSMKMGKTHSNIYDKDATITKMIADVLDAKNPFEAERLLIKYEFEMLETLVGLHTFDEYALFAYAIKLKLLERLNCFNIEQGKAEFKKLFDTVQQKVYSL